MNLKSYFYSMISIFLVRYPLQVISIVVKLVSILMIYLWFVVRIRNIQLSNKTVNKHKFTANRNPKISFSVWLWLYLSIPLIVDYFTFRCNCIVIKCKCWKPHD